MPRFFINEPVVDRFLVIGEDAEHIAKSLRMRLGETLVLCHDGIDYTCKIVGFEKNSVLVERVSAQPCTAEPQVDVTLFQGLPKGDKMDLIVQKAVEIGVCAIVPTLTRRCVSRPDEKKLQKKVQRWQKIALEAAKQSGRGIVPKVLDVLDFSKAVELSAQKEQAILFYEADGVPLKRLLQQPKSVAIFIGPEGGFEEEEVKLALESGVNICSLGNRILRTETAAIVASALTIYEAGPSAR